MLHCRSYFILVWCLILHMSHLDSSGAVTEQPLVDVCSSDFRGDVNYAYGHFDTFPLFSSCQQRISSLIVSHTKIKTIPRDALADFTALETMVLSHNIIQSIPAGAFRDLTQLHELLLQSNKLSSLESGVFKGLEGLDDRVNLRCNHLTRITTGVFNDLESVNILAIEENLIETIEVDSFNGMRELGYLYLKDNRIVRLVSGAFAGLGKLKRLDLRNNSIEVIESGAFDGLGALEELKLSLNRLTTVSGIAELPNLLNLDIADNRIKTVDNSFLLDILLHGDFKISIRDNPLDCTCKVEKLRIWYRQNRKFTDEARCATPAEYLNMTLVSITEHLPACPVPPVDSEKSSLDGKGNAEGSKLHSFIPIIPIGGFLVLTICIFCVIRWYTSKRQPVPREPQNNNNLEQKPEHRVDIVHGYEPDAYHTFLPHDERSNAIQMIEPQPPSLNGHAFKLSVEDGTLDLPSPTPEYLSFDDVNDPQSDEDIQSPLSSTRCNVPISQWRPFTRPAVPPRFFSSS